MARSEPRLDGEVNVWRIPLVAAPTVVSRMRDLLDDSERERAAAFRGHHLARRFILRHAARRLILGAVARRDPKSLRFEAGPAGKPQLILAPTEAKADDKLPDRIEFNDTDSGDRALIGLGGWRRIGIDLEEHRELDPDLWATREFFAPAERTALESLTDRARQAAFFACWTRKEALVKAMGTGLQTALDSFAVPVGRLPEKGVMVDLPGDGGRTFQFSLRNLDAGSGWSAALAMEGTGGELVWKDWNWNWDRDGGMNPPQR